MNRKRIFGIILFLLIGFFMFTFANPNEEINDEEKKPKTEEKVKKEKKGIQVIEPTEIDQKENSLEESVIRVETNRVVPTENNIPSVQPVDNSKEIEKALELEKAKKAAIEELENYRIEYEYSDKTAREVIVNEYTKAINESKDITDVDRLLKNAEAKIDELIKEDLSNYINDAIKAIEEHAKADEEYITEIKDEKVTGINKLDKIKKTDLEDIDLENIKNEIDEVVEVTNGNIDKIIENKTFKVTFVGKNNVKEEQIVKYKKEAQAPTSVKFNNPTYKDVTYELTGFDKEFSEVKSDLTVNALYKITNIKATIYLNNNEVPNDKYSNKNIKYTKIGTVNLKLDNEKINNIILNDKNANVYTNDDIDITTLFNEEPDVEKLENIYDYYEYYVVKFVSGSQAGFHIDCVKRHDDLRELNDTKERLNDLINSLPTNCNETYTSSTCSALDKAVNDSKNASTLTEILNAIDEINTAKNNLVEIVLDHITLTLNSDTYYLNGEAATLKVEAFYNEETKNGEINNYTTITSFDNTSVGSREVKVSYTFNGVTKEAVASYKVIYTDEQLKAIEEAKKEENRKLIEKIEISLENKKIDKKERHFIVVKNSTNAISNINISRKSKNGNVFSIDLKTPIDSEFVNSKMQEICANSDTCNVYEINKDDYKILSGKKGDYKKSNIVIVYTLNDTSIEAEYKVEDNKLYLI